MSFVLDGLILASGWLHVLLAPFTKVEESFNLHATHDVLMYGVQPSALLNYDHVINPGPVRRTFLGSLLLAWLSSPLIQLGNHFGYVSTKFDLQVAIRLVLATLNVITLSLVRRATARRFGRPTSFFFALLSISQFHIPFWMGRTVPNMFALVPVNFATYLLLDKGSNTRKPSPESTLRALSILTFSAIVFRAEIALLLAPIALQALVTRQVSFLSLLKSGLLSALISIGTTVTVDSYIWQQNLLWPEWDNFYFNVIKGKSAEWGTSPATTYIKVFLPKILLSSLPLSGLGFLLDKRIRTLLIPCIAFIGFISMLGHKEWRFIVYVVPMFNVGAARGLRWLVGLRKGSFFGRLAFLFALCAILVNFAATTVLTLSSTSNYPGGVALTLANTYISAAQTHAGTRAPHIHMSNLAAQTGASLFLHVNSSPFPDPSLVPAVDEASFSPWTYNKTEHIAFKDLLSSSVFTHLLAEASQVDEAYKVSKLRSIMDAEWEQVSVVDGFAGWQINPDLVSLISENRRRLQSRDELLNRINKLYEAGPLSMIRKKMEPQLVLLERKGWHTGR